MRHRVLLLATALPVLAACSAADGPTPVTPTIVEDDGDDEETYRIARADYEAVVKEGLQNVMRWYLLWPSYDQDRFVGYEVREIYKLELKDGPLRVGDVILSINDQPIERPEQTVAIWRGLWGQKSLKITIRRNGRTRVFDIPIVQ
jgi:type II secretory pathway component PulC